MFMLDNPALQDPVVIFEILALFFTLCFLFISAYELILLKRSSDCLDNRGSSNNKDYEHQLLVARSTAQVSPGLLHDVLGLNLNPIESHAQPIDVGKVIPIYRLVYVRQ